MINQPTLTRRESREQERANLKWDALHRKFYINEEGIDCVTLEDNSYWQGERSLIKRLRDFGIHVTFDVGVSHSKPIRDMTGKGNYTYDAAHYEHIYRINIFREGERKRGEGFDCFGNFYALLFDVKKDEPAKELGRSHFSEFMIRYAYRHALRLAERVSMEREIPVVDNTHPGIRKAIKELRRQRYVKQ